MLNPCHYPATNEYLSLKVPVVCMLLDPTGKITRINRFARTLFGSDIVGRSFKDILLDFSGEFDLETMQAAWQDGYMQSVNTLDGHPRTFIFHCYKGEKELLLFGHEDSEEQATLSLALVEANQELSNLTRELNAKNRELKRAGDKILELTRKDPLTNLANRRYFTERATEVLSLAKRNHEPVSLLMTDIDHFKRVNDQFGHDAGDRVLKGYANLMQENTRKEDLVVRFGGEEFIILLPFTDTKYALDMAERIRTRLESSDFLQNGYTVTASFGLAVYRSSGDIETTIKQADTALYEAKNTGRNKIVGPSTDGTNKTIE
ncbi:sensor domain-containing diguanylate cyclase [Desulforhopalus vacuolatus]|uniref:GGDEF domain-containing protein n=1 Tax=Desulforhopalus vacuolatus TaxID=40414 RepID=UPI00196428B4|nr:sensor domain-containing diguanylate cyclase [Desulforhopalus vacuolatus]MBM9520916.1 sensor domain-containing diguanylate cyclase [Desulforhopalus vacuolatus]